MIGRLAMTLVLLGPLAACVADTNPLTLGRRDAAVTTVDAASAPDVGAPPDRDGGSPDRDAGILPDRDGGPDRDAEISPDAGACAPGRTAVTLPGVSGDILDLSPTGDRLLSVEGDRVRVFALPSGQPVQELRGVRAVFASDGRQVLVDVGAGELQLHTEARLIVRVGTDFACFSQITPNRRYAVSVVGCAAADDGTPIGRLEIFDLESPNIVLAEDGVVSNSVVTTMARTGAPLVAYLRARAPTACSRCRSSDAEVAEVSLSPSAGDRSPPPPPLPTVRLLRLNGYDPSGRTLLGAGGGCDCDPELGAWDARSGQPIIMARVPSFAAPDALDSHGASRFAAVPAAHGHNGVAAYPSGGLQLVYAPYDTSQRAQVLLDRVVASPTAVLASGGRDSAVLGLDDQGHLVRIPLSAPQVVPEIISPRASFGVIEVVLTDDRGAFAFTVETGGQVIVRQLFVGTSGGPVTLAHSSDEGLRVWGFVAGRSELIVSDRGTLSIVRGASLVPLDDGSDAQGPVVSDARGCWLAHRQVADRGAVRVVPLP